MPCIFKLIEFLVYVAQASLTHEDILEPVMSKMWNDLLVRILQEGVDCELKGEEISLYEHFLGISLLKQDAKISVIYGDIFKALKYKYGNKELSHCFLRSNHITVVEKKYVRQMENLNGQLDLLNCPPVAVNNIDVQRFKGPS